MHRQMSQRQRNLGNRGNNNVPFGIRALESGIEVEGVWISRGNTPEPDSRDHSAASSLSERRKDSKRDLEKQDVSGSHNRSTSNSTNGTIRPERASFDRVVSAEKLSSSQRSKDSSVDRIITKPPRSRHPPLSFTKYSDNPYILRQSRTTNTLEGLDAIHRASTSIHGNSSTDSGDSSNPSSNSTDDSGPISASAPSLLTGRANPRPRKHSESDFELLNSHRISQAAETGQLTPRGRRPSQSHSVDFSSGGRSNRQSASVDRFDYFLNQSKSALSPGEKSPNNPFSTPKIDALPPAVRRSSMPDVTPFAEFCKRASHDQRPESLRSRSRDSAQSSAHQSDAYDSAPSSPIIPASEGAAELKLPKPKRGSFEKRASQVVRGHGSGFEILKPGSLNPSMPREHPMERQRAAAPVSLHNSMHGRTCSEDSRRKLQKKRWPSEDSTTGSENSRWSRISLL